MGRKVVEEPPPDPTGWILDSGFAEFVLMHTTEIKIMCMLGYVILHGAQLYPTFPKESSKAFRFISLILKCTGGGTLVPVFINAIPVNMGVDSYPVCIFISFLLHEYLPIFREVLNLSPILYVSMIILYESMRASVVTKLTLAAAAAIPASDFSFPVFGPIFCGAIGGCGGAFLPFNKGLDPIKTGGLGQPMLSALIAAACFHLFLNTSLSDGVVEATAKAKVAAAMYFILYKLYASYGNRMMSMLGLTSKTKTD